MNATVNVNTDAMTFGQAVEAMKAGSKVGRKGWNGKGMFLVFFSPVTHGDPLVGSFGDHFTVFGHGTYPLLPFILMKTADDKWVPWLASQTDILAEDWQIVVLS